MRLQPSAGIERRLIVPAGGRGLHLRRVPTGQSALHAHRLLGRAAGVTMIVLRFGNALYHAPCAMQCMLHSKTLPGPEECPAATSNAASAAGECLRAGLGVPAAGAAAAAPGAAPFSKV